MGYEFESSKWTWLYLIEYLTQGLPINIVVQIDNSLMTNNSNNQWKLINLVQLSVVGRKSAPPHATMHYPCIGSASLTIYEVTECN